MLNILNFFIDSLKENNPKFEAMVDNVPLSKFMQNLHDQGVCEVGSPASTYDLSPYIVPHDSKQFSTPDLNKTGENLVSQDTPVGKFIRGYQQRQVLPGTSNKVETSDSPLPRALDDIKTPDTPLGLFACKDGEMPSPNTRKAWQRRINKIPGPSYDPKLKIKNKRLSTPLSELTGKVWTWLEHKEKDECFESYSKRTNDKKKETPAEEIENNEVTNNLKQFQSMLSSNDGLGSGLKTSVCKSKTSALQRSRFSHLQCNLFPEKDSQPDMVGWADPVFSEDLLADNKLPERPPSQRKFMLSSMTPEQKQSYEIIIKNLGGLVSTAQQFDPSATHLVCITPSRNEKILSGIASGIYIIHSAYLNDSEKKGHFLDEQPYEFGNPSFLPEIQIELKGSTSIEAYYWWRKRIETTGIKAFVGMRILLMSNNKDALKRLIEAGDGTVINVNPPFAHNVDATHCLVDFKRISNFQDLIPLAKQGIPCVNIIFLSLYLNALGNIDIKEHIPVELKNYYEL